MSETGYKWEAVDLDKAMAKILIEDNSEFVRMMAKNILKEVGYTDFCEASNGAEAITVYKKESPDLVIMDIYLTDMKGAEAFESIKKIRTDAAFIMTTDGQKGINFWNLSEFEGTTFIIKPFDKKRLQEAVLNILK